MSRASAIREFTKIIEENLSKPRKKCTWGGNASCAEEAAVCPLCDREFYAGQCQKHEKAFRRMLKEFVNFRATK